MAGLSPARIVPCPAHMKRTRENALPGFCQDHHITRRRCTQAKLRELPRRKPFRRLPPIVWVRILMPKETTSFSRLAPRVSARASDRASRNLPQVIVVQGHHAGGILLCILVLLHIILQFVSRYRFLFLSLISGWWFFLLLFIDTHSGPDLAAVPQKVQSLLLRDEGTCANVMIKPVSLLRFGIGL